MSKELSEEEGEKEDTERVAGIKELSEGTALWLELVCSTKCVESGGQQHILID